jgi:hypothetical protein
MLLVGSLARAGGALASGGTHGPSTHSSVAGTLRLQSALRVGRIGHSLGKV